MLEGCALGDALGEIEGEVDGEFDVCMLGLFFNGNALDKDLSDMLGDALGEAESEIEGKVGGSALILLLGIVDGQRVGPRAGQHVERG